MHFAHQFNYLPGGGCARYPERLIGHTAAQDKRILEK